jgi:glyoxylase I family protein
MAPRPPPFVPEGIDHVLLLISGMETALKFYCDVLGLNIHNQIPQHAMVQLRAGGALIDLVDLESPQGNWARPTPAGGRNLDHICIALAAHDETALRAHLAQHQVAIVEEGMHGGARGESLSIYIRDPAGNSIELKGPPSAAKPQ